MYLFLIYDVKKSCFVTFEMLESVEINVDLTQMVVLFDSFRFEM